MIYFAPMHIIFGIWQYRDRNKPRSRNYYMSTYYMTLVIIFYSSWYRRQIDKLWAFQQIERLRQNIEDSSPVPLSETSGST